MRLSWERGRLAHPRPHTRERAGETPALPGDGLSKSEHVSDEIVLFLLVQLQAEDQVEELNGVGERQQTSVVQVGRRVLDAAQSERLDRPIGQHDLPIYSLPDLVEALELQVMHHVVQERRLWNVALRTTGLAEKQSFTGEFAF